MSRRPTWDELTEASCTAYAHGYAHGLRDARRVAEVEARTADLAAAAAEAVSNAAADMGVPAARERADRAPGAAPTSRGWAA